MNDGAYGGGGVFSLLADARPRTSCALCDLEVDERDVLSMCARLSTLGTRASNMGFFFLTKINHTIGLSSHHRAKEYRIEAT